MKQKQEIRIRLISQRESLGKDARDNAGDIITRALIDSKILQDKNNILCYIPVNNEVETKLLIDDLQALHQKVYVPAYDKDEEKYVFAQFNGWDNLVVGPYDVLQPVDSHEIDVDEIDLVVL